MSNIPDMAELESMIEYDSYCIRHAEVVYPGLTVEQIQEKIKDHYNMIVFHKQYFPQKDLFD